MNTLKSTYHVFIQEIKKTYSKFLIVLGIFLGLYVLVFTSKIVNLLIIYKTKSLVDASSLFYIGYFFLIIAMPLFLMLISYNSISKERESRSIRFLASKISRVSIYFGKFISLFLYSVLSIFLLLSFLYFYCMSKNLFYGLENIFAIFTFLVFYSSMWISIYLLVSLYSKSPLLFSNFIAVGMLFINILKIGYSKYLSPYYYVTQKIIPNFLYTNTLYMVIYSIVVILIACFYFEVIDL